ncbi:helix-turn-helix domain-containing protein [Halanaeroarchaeum sulfurireducens]|uniref:Transcription regulator n=1 Tax=Halanaeroarchaeum sulfurireducens TaxID=1604004 RepID=A0A0F7PDP8_9EURY|nr:helix-turn-helix domain-containing protein [Halanaeroarchaeum sulfurireducens]AKH97769.1 transcription regulator [Halanaeroarchaeum sulfurireducens]ALG82164.1 transcription regulator [Halanaeroarchaeum sulfurireducens]
MATKSARLFDNAVEQRELQVVYEIKPGSACPLTTIEDDIEVKDVRTQFRGSDADCESMIEAHNPDEDQYLITHNTCEGRCCPGRAFAEFDAIPSVENVTGDSMIVEAYLDDRADLRDLTESLRGRSEMVSLLRVKENAIGRLSDDLIDVDLSMLTTKQREALDVAIEMGYFEEGKQVTLADMAKPFDISRQAFSERLAAAERKIMTQLAL